MRMIEFFKCSFDSYLVKCGQYTESIIRISRVRQIAKYQVFPISHAVDLKSDNVAAQSTSTN